ncbi:Hypothetical protein A7982_07935 [Minicystis rosea]|nr:Hypothetical protein A7982_07935 [Minicystis rosea]
MLDPKAIEAATGRTPEVVDDVVKVSYPRDEVKVEIDGWPAPPFMGLTAWAAFTPSGAGAEAMVMGDMVLFEDEVSEAMSAAFRSGLHVTALHNHFFFDRPRVFFMHIAGEGSVDRLGAGVRSILDVMKAVRARSPEPASGFEGPAIPETSSIDASQLEAVFGLKAATKDGMAKITVGRVTQAENGRRIGSAMGINTWAAFAGTDDNAVVDGDFAVTEDELQPVLRALRDGGIHIVAIHNHMVGEKPRILFLHYWGRGDVTSLATVVKRAVDLTKTGS